MAITLADLNVSYVAAVTRFVEASPWLSDKHLPQLKALMDIAKELDMPGQKKTAALVAQFTLTQRTLLGKAPEAGGEGPEPIPGLDTWGPTNVHA